MAQPSSKIPDNSINEAKLTRPLSARTGALFNKTLDLLGDITLS